MLRNIIFLCFLGVTSLFGGKTWFFLQDAGETYALLPVIERLDENKLSYAVITAGVATDIMKYSDISKDHLYTLEDFDLPNVPKDWPREKRISGKKISKLMDRLDIDLFITGVAYLLQGQMMQECKNRQIKSIAYWDNFSAFGNNSYFQTAHHVKEKADLLFVPSQSVASDLFSKSIPTIVIGHPSLEKWKKSLDLYDNHLPRISKGEEKLITYVGGYGKDYEEAFHFFLDILRNSGFKGGVMIQPHPKSDKNFESITLDGWEIEGVDIQVMEDISTFALVALSDLIVCYNSSVGMQALAAGKKVVYVVPPSHPYSNAVIDKKAAPVVCSVEDWQSAISSKNELTDLYSLMGIPKDSVSRFVQEIQKITKEQSLTQSTEERVGIDAP